MCEKEKEIKYSDALVLTTDNRFYKGEVTMHANSIDLLLSFNTSYEIGDRIHILDILVDPSSRQDLFFD